MHQGSSAADRIDATDTPAEVAHQPDNKILMEFPPEEQMCQRWRRGSRHLRRWQQPETESNASAGAEGGPIRSR